MNKRVYVIAEAGVNHNGSLDLARELVSVAARAGADAVKFQTFKADKLVSRAAPKAQYQRATTDAEESQHEMIRKLELSDADHEALIAHCKVCNIDFLSTPFDLDSLALLAGRFDLPLIKMPSGDITNAPLLLAAARTGKPVILSTGMSTLGEIEQALGVLAFGYSEPEAAPSMSAFEQAYVSAAGRAALQARVTLLHCTTEYPAPFADVNLRAMTTLANAFDLPAGYSDHTVGIAVPIAAVAMGAVVIEKHFTTDRNLPGPDHQASLEPDELAQMIRSIREVEMSLGSAVKQAAPSELKNRAIARKSLVAGAEVRKGEVFTADNLDVKRPGDGLSPVRYWELLGTVADRDYGVDDKVQR
ncbi:N-acetylneuraminate synthase [Herbaspirillum sp. CF444]|uniref:N-acetylneuraminate synthase n=1 Tax=Herbaspirillum sp. CF444 TaxID=1144319 RepID=UPI0002722E14|nr:N-acetylneuraminate synthase [Herbaspirillum sp. CF444]EJL81415.1 N-acetylneuraminate synthase [Herbaspirillum sp. CF444]